MGRDCQDRAFVPREDPDRRRLADPERAVGARGESPNGKAPAFRDIYRLYPAETLDEAFRRGLLTRHPAMPELRLLPQEIADLVAYFRTLRGLGVAEAGKAAHAARPAPRA